MGIIKIKNVGKILRKYLRGRHFTNRDIGSMKMSHEDFNETYFSRSRFII